jgi:hypothetical protein
MKKLFVLLFFISSMAISATSPDYAKEARWAEQVEESILDGDSVWLSVDEHEFFTIFTEDESEGNEAAIIVHGTGVHPDWTQVIQPLRVGLTENGFNTLSIQMPVLENGMHGIDYKPLFPGAGRRIMSAVKYLKGEGFNPTTLIGHSLGTVMSTHFLANNKHTFEKFVAVGMGRNAVQFLSNIDLAVLDLYGNEDLESVLSSTKDKMNASKHNQNYTQKMVNADHFFNNQDDLLISEVSTWLK